MTASKMTARAEPERSRARAGTYRELRRRIAAAGLLDPQPGYYAVKFVTTFALLAGGLTVLVAVHRPALQLLDAIFLAFASTQVAFLGHDAAHHEVFQSRRLETMAGLILGNLLLGLSKAWWLGNHNAHHNNPNDVEHDPDANIAVLAFTEDQARRSRGLARLIVRRQHRLLFPMFCLENLSQHRQAVRVVFSRRDVPHRGAEISLLAAHALGYCLLIFSALGLAYGLLFIAIHKALSGLYMASVFAPNHKGMPVLESGERPDFLHRQVLTSRNIRGNLLIDFWYGGLNYQIEHHLLPMMPRNRLREAQPIVKAFCAAHGLSYHETGMIQSYREMIAYFRQVSEVLRRPEPR